MEKQIVVVDDEQAILDVMQSILESEGYEVITTCTSAYFQHLHNHLPDLIILDIRLKGEDGREICRQLKERGPTKHIPIILSSAHCPASQAISDSHADGFLAKPFHLQELLDTVQKFTCSPSEE